MPLISDEYREQNRLLHETNASYGISGVQWVGYVNALIEQSAYADVLDYGAGKGMLAAGLREAGRTVYEYDPAVPGKDTPPEPADLVVCTDVLEHVESVYLNTVLRDLKRLTKRKLFVNIAVGPSSKTLPDGRNAHLIVKDADWWREKLSQHFQIARWEPRQLVVFGELFPKRDRKAIDLDQHRVTQKRRALTPEFAKWFDLIRTQSAKYNDAFSRIETIRMWEGGIDEQPADMQVVVGLIEYVDDIDRALREVISVARKGVMLCIRLHDDRTEPEWRRTLETRLRISDWHVENGGLVCIGAPAVNVQGLTAIGAVDTDKRWEQVKASVARFQGRIARAGAHGRRAILACYGPSLASTIDLLKREAQDPNTDVISVSGAHDFLLQHGIVPRYHVECDPRPHKADNIKAGHHEVDYLIASVCAGPLFDKLPAENIKLWHVASSEHAVPLIDELGEKVETVISGGGSVGLRSIPLLYEMGYRDLYIFAMDCSFRLAPEDQAKVDAALATGDVEQLKPVLAAITGAQQWAGPHAGKTQDICPVVVGHRLFVTSPQLMSYATNFWEMVQKMPDVGYRLYGDGLLQAMGEFYERQAALSETQEAA